jgi:hypothetical protein
MEIIQPITIYPLDSYGISKFNANGWLNIPYKDVLSAQS